jgi:hypothetical protein
MSTPLVEKLAKETGRTVAQVERHWERAKALADKRFMSKSSEYYQFATQVLHNTLSVSTLNRSEDVGGRYLEVSLSKKVKLVGAVRNRSKAKRDHTGKTWWEKKSREEQLAYLKDKPNSKFKHKLKANAPDYMTHTNRDPEEVIDEEADPEGHAPARPRQVDLITEPVPEGAPIIPEETPEPLVTHENGLEPASLNGLTHIGRGLLHQAATRSMGKLQHIAKSNKETFKGGLKALKKFSADEAMSKEDKEHLKDMTIIMMGVILASAVAFGPFMPFAGSMAHMYLDQLTKRKEKKKDDEEDEPYEDDYEPPVLSDEPEVNAINGEGLAALQHVTTDVVDWIASPRQDHEALLNKARSLNNRGN